MLIPHRFWHSWQDVSDDRYVGILSHVWHEVGRDNKGGYRRHAKTAFHLASVTTPQLAGTNATKRRIASPVIMNLSQWRLTWGKKYMGNNTAQGQQIEICREVTPTA